MTLETTPLKPVFCLYTMALIFYDVIEPVNSQEEPVIDPSIPENFDRNCYKKYGGPNFLAFVVRLINYDWHDNGKIQLLATGNIITEQWILTACTPFYKAIDEQRLDTVRALPAVTPYTEVLPDREKGIFPIGSTKEPGCIVGYYHVNNKEVLDEDNQIIPQDLTVTGEKCRKDTANFSIGMADNLLLLKMASEITVGDYMIFPRMPFSYSFEALVEKIDWFNTYRKARCIVAKLDRSNIESNLFEPEGFTYKTIAYRTECIPAVCKINCTEIADSADCKRQIEKTMFCKELQKCMDYCYSVMAPLLGTLLCLTRMHEHEKGDTLLYSLVYDEKNEQIPYVENNDDCVPKSGEHISPVGFSPPILGAPVICDGEAIAIVTKCHTDFIMATSIVGIRHRLLKLFDTSYQDRLVYLSEQKP